MSKDIVKFSIQFANTVTFQTWNFLGCDFRHKDIGLNIFKSNLTLF